MKKFTTRVALVCCLAIAGGAGLPQTAAAQDATATGADTERRGVLCGLWALQRLAEEVGILSATDRSIAEDAYPVPAPVWVVENLLALN